MKVLRFKHKKSAIALGEYSNGDLALQETILSHGMIIEKDILTLNADGLRHNEVYILMTGIGASISHMLIKKKLITPTNNYLTYEDKVYAKAIVNKEIIDYLSNAEDNDAIYKIDENYIAARLIEEVDITNDIEKEDKEEVLEEIEEEIEEEEPKAEKTSNSFLMSLDELDDEDE